jgi:hypothetical protein
MRRLLLAVTALGLGTTVAPASAAPSDRQLQRAVSWAVAQTGHREIGTTNRSRLIDAWERDMGVGPGRPWCGALVHQAFLRQGIKLSARLIDPHRSYQDAQAGRRGLRAIRVSQVRKGDILFYKFRRGVLASHLAIARGPVEKGRIRSIEGNVSHTVSQETRSARYVVLAARVTG